MAHILRCGFARVMANVTRWIGAVGAKGVSQNSPHDSRAEGTVRKTPSPIRQLPIRAHWVTVIGRMRVTYKLTLLGAALVLVAAACSDDDASSEVSAASTSTTTAAPSTNTTPTTEGVLATPLPADVTETYTIPGFGYSIDYPADWFVTTDDSFTLIAQTEEEFAARLPVKRTTYSVVDPIPPAVALRISLDHRTVLFLQSIGLTSDDPTAQDLLEFNIDNFDWTVLRDLGEVEIFGTTAVVVRVTDPDGSFSIQYQGVLTDSGEVFIFGFAGPTEESVDAFLPAWETMIESITATG